MRNFSQSPLIWLISARFNPIQVCAVSTRAYSKTRPQSFVQVLILERIRNERVLFWIQRGLNLHNNFFSTYLLIPIIMKTREAKNTSADSISRWWITPFIYCHVEMWLQYKIIGFYDTIDDCRLRVNIMEGENGQKMCMNGRGEVGRGCNRMAHSLCPYQILIRFFQVAFMLSSFIKF